MRQVAFPTVAKIKAWALAVMAHSRGYVGVGSHYNFERAPGARVTGSLEFTPMRTEDALRMRAFIHSQRGKSGTFAMPVINGTSKDAAPLVLLADAAAGADSVSIESDGRIQVGDWMLVDGQLVRAVAIANGSATLDEILWDEGDNVLWDEGDAALWSAVDASAQIRPRLRAAVTEGADVSAGAVTAEFRILDDAPVIPLIPGRSREFSIEIEEAY